MKYRHSYHAGNFADVHKHVTLLALLAALRRKEKGFFYLDTHAGRGTYQLTSEGPREAQLGVERIAAAQSNEAELQQYASAVAAFRTDRGDMHAYPGSPVLAAQALRPQDRAVFVEIMPSEARVLEKALAERPRMHVECDDGFARLRAHLPPAERRGLTFIDPPYEETQQDFSRVQAAIGAALQRFATGVVAAWYPIKQESDSAARHAALAASLGRDALLSELWVFPRDSRVGLNGSGLVIVNAPYLIAERMQAWLPQLHARLDVDGMGGWSARALS